MTGRKLLITVSLLLLALVPVCALAVDVKAQTSTQYLWCNDPFLGKIRGDLLQYVKTSPFACPCLTNITTAAELRASYNTGSSPAIQEPMCTTTGMRLNCSSTLWTNWTTAA